MGLVCGNLEEEFVNQIACFWALWRSQKFRFPSLLKWWEAGKSEIKVRAINYCCVRSAACSGMRGLLVNLASHLKTQVDRGALSCLGPYHSLLENLADLDKAAAQGVQVRARACWIEEGESSSAYFFRLEKKHGSEGWISTLREDDGTVVSSPVDLCRSLSGFYNLAYVNRNLQTTYFTSETVFVVPPTMFLGDNEEIAIVKWLKTEKASFLKTQRFSRKASTTIHSPTSNWTQEEEREIQYSTEVFKQLLNGEIHEQDIEDDTELPNFSLGFDFMALGRELPKTSVGL